MHHRLLTETGDASLIRVLTNLRNAAFWGLPALTPTDLSYCVLAQSVHASIRASTKRTTQQRSGSQR